MKTKGPNYGLLKAILAPLSDNLFYIYSWNIFQKSSNLYFKIIILLCLGLCLKFVKSMSLSSLFKKLNNVLKNLSTLVTIVSKWFWVFFICYIDFKISRYVYQYIEDI